MCTDMRTDMCTDMFTDMCLDMCIDTHIDMRHMFRYVSKHAHRYVYRHVDMHAYASARSAWRRSAWWRRLSMGMDMDIFMEMCTWICSIVLLLSSLYTPRYSGMPASVSVGPKQQSSLHAQPHPRARNPRALTSLTLHFADQMNGPAIWAEDWEGMDGR